MPTFPYKIPGVSVYKRSGAGPRSCWLAAYKIAGQPRVKAERLSFDVQIAARLARKIADRVAAAQIDPRAGRQSMMELRPLWVDRAAGQDNDRPDQPGEASHLADYHRVLIAEGNTPAHCASVIGKCRKIFRAINVNRISEIMPGPVKVQISELTDSRRIGRWSKKHKKHIGAQKVPASPQTKNHHLRAVKQFFAWLAGPEQRAATDPLKHLASLNMKVDRRHVRRALTDQELSRLLWSTRRGPSYLGLSGPDRAMLYETAVQTGFRANELRTLTPRQCELAGPHPFLRVIAAFSKHREEDLQQLMDPDFTLRLARYIDGLPIDDPIWKIPAVPADLMRFDIERAGVPYVDASGRYADFHCLRHTAITRWTKNIPDIAVVARLARHKDVKMTMRYSHLSIHDLRTALANLPPIPRYVEDRQRALFAATGTDDAKADAGANHSAPVSPSDVWTTSTDAEPGNGGADAPGGARRKHEKEADLRQPPAAESSRPTEPKVEGSSPSRCVDLTEVTGAGRKRRSANDSAAKTDEERLAAAVQKVSAYIQSNRKSAGREVR